MKIKKMLKVPLWASLTATFGVLMTAVLIGNYFAEKYPAQINSFFNTKTYEIVKGDSDADTQYYKPKFQKEDGTADKEKLYEYDKSVAKSLNNEGSVLLWNHENALPLQTSEKLNLFGGRSANLYFVTDGSGGVRMSESPKLKDSLVKNGFSVNEELDAFYSTHSYGGGTSAINETDISAVGSETLNSIKGGVGIYVIGRKGSEGSDLAMTGSDGTNGNLTSLSTAEINTIEKLISLKSEGKLDKVIVLLNTVSGGLQFDQLMSYQEDIDACMWVGLGGTSSPDSIAELLIGKANPSGRLSDTFVFNNFTHPSSMNLGDYNFSNLESFQNDEIFKKLSAAQGSTDSTEKNLKYLVYQEGIYVGYKYFETRYEDSILNKGNAGSTKGTIDNSAWEYKNIVAYPFGYGLSYTDFEYSDYKVVKNDEGYEISLKVTNVGDTYTGKDVVQIYLQKPYTAYDKENNVEQASVNLVGYAKTKELAPNEYDVVSIQVDNEEFYTYDSNKAKTYILEDGDYYLAFGENAHDATNNILKAKGFDGDEVGNASFTYKVSLKGEYDTYISRHTGEEISNKFNDADINKAGYDLDKITYLSRSDWDKTYPSKVDVKLTSKLLKELDYGKSFEDDPFDGIPTYGSSEQVNLMMAYKDTNGNNLDYDHEIWDKILDHTTFEEQVYLVCNAWCATQAIPSVNAPGTENRDGPAGLNYLPDNKVIGLGMCYPSENLMASSFNNELVQKIGECIGEDNLACGFTFIYGPGANVHRSPFGGRNGEYYSEDGFLSGEMCATEVIGIQSNGAGAQMKHFALNDTEVNRNGVAIWANEQSIREIYLKAFEKACAKDEAQALSIMSSFNRIGANWAGAHKGLLTDVLRDEWGFIGFVQSDGNGYALMSNYIDGIRAGNDLFMCGGGRNALDKYKNSPTITNAIRESTHRVLYVLLRTNAINGLGADDQIKTLTPWWRTGIDTLIYLTITLTAISGVLLIASIVVKFQNNKKLKEEIK